MKSAAFKKLTRYLLVITLLLVAALAIPPSRHVMLNTVGLRGTAVIKVLDQASNLPLKNVTVAIGGQSGLTDAEGVARLSGTRLGRQELTITKAAYAAHTDKLTIEPWTTKPEPLALTPSGRQYRFVLKDWLSGEPIEGAEVEFETNSVYSSNDGLAILTIPEGDTDFSASFFKSGYRVASQVVSADEQDIVQVKLVISPKHYFFKERGTSHDLMQVDADGKNAERLRVDVGPDTERLQLVNTTSGRYFFAVVDKASGEEQELIRFDKQEQELVSVTTGEQLRIYGQTEGQLVVTITRQVNDRSTLFLELIDVVELTHTKIYEGKSFNDLLVAGDVVYYATSGTDGKLLRFSAGSTEPTIVHAAEVWNIYASTREAIVFNAKTDWYERKSANGAISLLETRPDNLLTRLYVMSPGGELAAYVDYQQESDQLMLVNLSDGQISELDKRGGISDPLVWLDDDHLVYRQIVGSGSHDYVISVTSGKRAQITQVTEVGGYEKWYYY